MFESPSQNRCSCNSVLERFIFTNRRFYVSNWFGSPLLFRVQTDCAFSSSLFSDLLKVSYITYLFPFLHCSPYKLNVLNSICLPASLKCISKNWLLHLLLKISIFFTFSFYLRASKYDQVAPCLSRRRFCFWHYPEFYLQQIYLWMIPVFVGCKVNWMIIHTNVASLSKICSSVLILGSCKALASTSLCAPSASVSVQPCHGRFSLTFMLFVVVFV